MIYSDDSPHLTGEFEEARNLARAVLLQMRQVAEQSGISELNKAINEWRIPLKVASRQIGELVCDVHRLMTSLSEARSPVIRAIASIDWPSWWNKQREVFLAAAKAGWFMQPEMSPALVMADAEGRLPEDFEECFIAELTARLGAIEARLIQRFPARAHLIREGFLLHREQRYYSSIPMLLNSAEGIVTESTNKSPFNTSSSVPHVAGWTKNLPVERFEGLLSEALTVPHPLSQHGHDGRHRINHGASIDYGTELLSLKAISFLGFAGWLFAEDGPLAEAAMKAGWVRTSRGWQAPRK